jgi:hypothetical protein
MSEKQRDASSETVREPSRDMQDDSLTTMRDPVAETERAPFRSPREIVLLVMLLLVLLLIAVATGRGLLIRPGAAGGSGAALPPIPTRIPGSGLGGSQIDNSGGPNMSASGPPVCSPPGGPQIVSSRFRPYYDQHGGMETFGRPISAELLINGRPSQWFERALLEDWSNQAPPYDVQGGLIGFQFTKGIPFPKQAPFVSQPGIRYFAETGHGVREPFLSFWEQRGGLDIFGYPISEDVQERLPGDAPGQTHTVQYFERVRLELHSDQSDPGQRIQIGLLGSALCLADSKPNITNLGRPTPVPVP